MVAKIVPIKPEINEKEEKSESNEGKSRAITDTRSGSKIGIRPEDNEDKTPPIRNYKKILHDGESEEEAKTPIEQSNALLEKKNTEEVKLSKVRLLFPAILTKIFIVALSF